MRADDPEAAVGALRAHERYAPGLAVVAGAGREAGEERARPRSPAVALRLAVPLEGGRPAAEARDAVRSGAACARARSGRPRPFAGRAGQRLEVEAQSAPGPLRPGEAELRRERAGRRPPRRRGRCCRTPPPPPAVTGSPRALGDLDDLDVRRQALVLAVGRVEAADAVRVRALPPARDGVLRRRRPARSCRSGRCGRSP